MNSLDYVIIAIILLFGIWGWKKGFVQAFGGIIGIVIATILAGKYFITVGDFLGGSQLANILAFIAIFVITIELVSLMFWVFGKIFRIVSILPFVETFNKSLGAVLGLAGGILFLAVLLYFLNKFPLNPWFTESMKTSSLANIFLAISIVFQPLLPDSIKTLKGVI